MTHDLIYFNGPLCYRDLVQAYIACFGSARYDGIKVPLTFLRHIGSLSAKRLPWRGEQRWFYRSTRPHPYFSYLFDEAKQLARAHLYYLKHDPERLQ